MICRRRGRVSRKVVIHVGTPNNGCSQHKTCKIKKKESKKKKKKWES